MLEICAVKMGRRNWQQAREENCDFWRILWKCGFLSSKLEKDDGFIVFMAHEGLWPPGGHKYSYNLVKQK